MSFDVLMNYTLDRYLWVPRSSCELVGKYVKCTNFFIAYILMNFCHWKILAGIEVQSCMKLNRIVCLVCSLTNSRITYHCIPNCVSRDFFEKAKNDQFFQTCSKKVHETQFWHEFVKKIFFGASRKIFWLKSVSQTKRVWKLLI